MLTAAAMITDPLVLDGISDVSRRHWGDKGKGLDALMSDRDLDLTIS